VDTQRQPHPVADSVRLAWPSEAAAIAAIQRRGWDENLPPEAREAVLGSVDVEDMTKAWEQAISRPPDARCRVLVAVAQSDAAAGQSPVTGFAATLPCPDTDAHPRDDGMIHELVVDPPAQRHGHGSRLLNACADTLRADGFARAHCWLTSTDDRGLAFLRDAGWQPDGAHREIGTSDGAGRLKQVRLHTDIEAQDQQSAATA
jgi:GNAT superfamily N-acetyltransferase